MTLNILECTKYLLLNNALWHVIVDLQQLCFSLYMCTECSVVCITRPKYYLHVVYWKAPPFVLYPSINTLPAYVCTCVCENILSQGTLQFLEEDYHWHVLLDWPDINVRYLRVLGNNSFQLVAFFLPLQMALGEQQLLPAFCVQFLANCCWSAVSDISFLCMMTVLESWVLQSWRILWWL
jgi:hypothetical protein